MASDADFMLEVIGHDLPEPEERAFVEEAAAMLNNCVPRSLHRRIAGLLGTKSDLHQRVVFQFDEADERTTSPFASGNQANCASSGPSGVQVGRRINRVLV